MGGKVEAQRWWSQSFYRKKTKERSDLRNKRGDLLNFKTVSPALFYPLLLNLFFSKNQVNSAANIKIQIWYLRMVVHTCNLSTQKAEPGESLRIQGQPGLWSEFKANLKTENVAQASILNKCGHIHHREFEPARDVTGICLSPILHLPSSALHLQKLWSFSDFFFF